jgi:PilZ domain-containing protein
MKRGAGPRRARFAWSRFVRLGVDNSMKFEGLPKGRELASRSPRVDSGFLVRVSCAAGEFPARITNLSSSGFRLHSARPLEVGWEILLEVPRRAPVKCLVRWSSGKEAGGVFEEPAAL